MKKSLLVAIIGVIVLIGGGILAYQMSQADNKSAQNNLALTVTFSEPIGDQVPQTVIQDIIGESITNVQPTTGNITNVCKYYLNETDYVALRLNKLSYETQKTVNKESGAILSEDNSIIS
ncbi:MAG TPA: hypothetical protein PKN87_08230 [Syntrophomonadaceae bacterium]|nr:hypothetical protein [Syntrophomonadaceae bacterium]